jgi:biofilm protein TabA
MELREMLFSHVRHVEQTLSTLPEPLQAAVRHLRDTDFEKLDVGNYDLRGKDIYVQVVDLMTKPPSELRPEVHRQYIDVQFLCRGRERIGVADDSGNNEIAEDLLAERDIRFYRGIENETMLEMVPGNFAIFFPWDVHRPACQADGPQPIRKVVVKVRLAALSQDGGDLGPHGVG